jgi:hypothetical protein
MSQFHFSDEENRPADSAAAQPPKSGEPSAKDVKADPFQLDDIPPKPVLKPNSSGSQVAGGPTTPPTAPKGPRPLQPRPNNAMPPKPPVKAAVTPPLAEEVVPTQEAATAASISNDMPVDGFSAFLLGVGDTLRKVLNLLEVPATWVLRVAVPIGVLCLAYILAGILLGGNKGAANPTQFAELVKNMTLAATGLKFCLVAIGISFLILGYEDNRLGAVTAAVGVLLHFALPIGLKVMAPNVAGAVVAQQMRVAGFALLIIGLIKATCDLGIFLFNLPNTIKAKQASIGAARPLEAKQQRIARDANMFSPCWNLPFCREAIRKLCPAFLAKKTCWKFGRGCYCDEEMIARIVRGESLEKIKAPTRVSQSKKPPCGRCYIYLEHQSYKFRMLSPLALPATIAICYGVWPIYSQIFKGFDKAFNSILTSLSFASINLTPDAIKATDAGTAEAAKYATDPEVAAMWAQNIVGVMLGFILLIYVSKFIEWVVYKAKL